MNLANILKIGYGLTKAGELAATISSKGQPTEWTKALGVASQVLGAGVQIAGVADAKVPDGTGTQGKPLPSNPDLKGAGTPGQQRGLKVQQEALKQQNLNPGKRLQQGVNNRRILGLDKATKTRIDIANNSNYDMDPGSMVEGYSKSDPMKIKRIIRQ